MPYFSTSQVHFIFHFTNLLELEPSDPSAFFVGKDRLHPLFLFSCCSYWGHWYNLQVTATSHSFQVSLNSEILISYPWKKILDPYFPLHMVFHMAHHKLHCCSLTTTCGGDRGMEEGKKAHSSMCLQLAWQARGQVFQLYNTCPVTLKNEFQTCFPVLFLEVWYTQKAPTIN